MSERILTEWAGEKLELLADRAVFWPRMHTLIIADPHFGKPSAFRSAGIPVPAGTTSNDLARLTAIIDMTNARRLVVLGDFFHHRSGQCDRTMGMLAEWRIAHAELDILVVMGNHDAHSHPPPASWQMRYEQRPVTEAPFMFCHEPCRETGLFVLSGHIHPSVTLRDPIGHSLRVPCFLFREDHALLPAFGGFTGTATVRPEAGDGVYGLVDGNVMQIPVRAGR